VKIFVRDRFHDEPLHAARLSNERHAELARADERDRYRIFPRRAEQGLELHGAFPST